jgi:phage FluMu protein gp41
MTTPTNPVGDDMTEKGIRESMTPEQIRLERKLTCEAIDGAIAFGYQNTNEPPSDDHWLAPFWKIGRKMATLEQEDAEASAICAEWPWNRRAPSPEPQPVAADAALTQGNVKRLETIARQLDRCASDIEVTDGLSRQPKQLRLDAEYLRRLAAATPTFAADAGAPTIKEDLTVAGVVQAASTSAPYPNCQFEICDLPGQCVSEGKCHHPHTKRQAGALSNEQLDEIYLVAQDSRPLSEFREEVRALFATPATTASADAEDAARYRWLRDQGNSLETQQRDKGIVNGPSCYHEVGGIRELKWGDDLDAAIDAARKGACT